MLNVEERYLDAVTETFYRTLRGEKPALIDLPADYPQNELAQAVSYINRFIGEYNEFAEFMYSLSRGELQSDPPKGKMRVLQSFKSLQASLRHLTWKTQQIANGDFSQKVDFMGDFSAAFNKMTQQLQQAFSDLERANGELAHKNQQITDSIRYAVRIQQAMLPLVDNLTHGVAELFVIYQPRDIVSGDFYWCHAINQMLLLAVVDCTGHGVPGAFLSMIGQALLNKIALEQQIYDPAAILEELHRGIRTALQQQTGDAMDGMDVALCQIDQANRRVKFAGAKRPLYHVTPAGLTEIKGDRKSVGGHQLEAQRVFTTSELAVQPGDMLYLTTDGLADQSNPDGAKFGSKTLKELFTEVAPQPAAAQKDRIITKLQAHQQHEPQRDDVTLIGVRV